MSTYKGWESIAITKTGIGKVKGLRQIQNLIEDAETALLDFVSDDESKEEFRDMLGFTLEEAIDPKSEFYILDILAEEYAARTSSSRPNPDVWYDVIAEYFGEVSMELCEPEAAQKLHEFLKLDKVSEFEKKKILNDFKNSHGFSYDDAIDPDSDHYLLHTIVEEFIHVSCFDTLEAAFQEREPRDFDEMWNSVIEEILQKATIQ